MPISVFESISDLTTAVGTTLGQSPWMTVTQREIDLFAEATRDRQWIHIDLVKAAAGPFGATVAHGFLTLSLVPLILNSTVHIEGLTMVLNYGTNKVRFTSPLLANTRIRGTVELVRVAPKKHGTKAIFRVTIASEGSYSPVCVAETVALLVP